MAPTVQAFIIFLALIVFCFIGLCMFSIAITLRLIEDHIESVVEQEKSENIKKITEDKKNEK